ncbi:tyrosine-type recombinase/integrase [Acidaminococcus sp.]|uniref:tyrosine-type recombinase/integrase n=1 Tax=Acidaminococcus sp. TaxID=1872103 RepID=UPI003D7EBBDC
MDYHFSYRTKNDSVCLILSYKVGKKWRQKTRQGFKTQREARQHQDELLEEVKRSEGLTTDARLKDMTLRQFFGIYYRDKKDFLSYNTLMNYKNSIESLGAVADTPLRELTTASILNALLAQDVTAGTKKTKLRCISPVLEYAVKVYKIMAVNPARGITIREERGPKIIRAFTRAELSKLMILLEHKPLCRLVAILAANTGMRFGEIAGLPWDAINWSAQAITIRQQYASIGPRKMGVTPCKTRNSNRVIPASPVVLKALADWRQSQPLNLSGTVFPLNQMQNVHVKLNRIIRGHFPGRSVHALRHTFATLLLSKTGDINLVAHILGDTVTTVSEIYVNYTADIRQKAAEAMAGLY